MASFFHNSSTFLYLFRVSLSGKIIQIPCSICAVATLTLNTGTYLLFFCNLHFSCQNLFQFFWCNDLIIILITNQKMCMFTVSDVIFHVFRNTNFIRHVIKDCLILLSSRVHLFRSLCLKDILTGLVVAARNAAARCLASFLFKFFLAALVRPDDP